MTKEEAFAKLKLLSSDLSQVAYEDIVDILKNQIKRLPVPIGKLAKGTLIDRVRKNDGENHFTDVHNELSYIKDQNVIDNYLTEFGRANKPHQPMFYGAVESSLIDVQRVTAFCETAGILKDKNAVNFAGELYTVSRWKTTSELLLAEVVFASEAIRTNPDIAAAFERQKQFALESGDPDINFHLEFLVFISEEFARPAKSHHDYKIAVAFTDVILAKLNIHGIAYPSVQTKYQGQNIVLLPKVVDEYLTVEKLAMQRLHKNKERSLITNFKNCKTPNECLDAIKWEDLDPRHLSSKEQIEQKLTSDE